jgi:hypothetical protein
MGLLHEAVFRKNQASGVAHKQTVDSNSVECGSYDYPHPVLMLCLHPGVGWSLPVK